MPLPAISVKCSLAKFQTDSKRSMGGKKKKKTQKREKGKKKKKIRPAYITNQHPKKLLKLGASLHSARPTVSPGFPLQTTKDCTNLARWNLTERLLASPCLYGAALEATHPVQNCQRFWCLSYSAANKRAPRVPGKGSGCTDGRCQDTCTFQLRQTGLVGTQQSARAGRETGTNSPDLTPHLGAEMICWLPAPRESSQLLQQPDDCC